MEVDRCPKYKKSLTLSSVEFPNHLKETVKL